MTENQLEPRTSKISSLTRDIEYEKSHQSRNLKNAIFEIQKEPPMLITLDLISSLDKNREIILKAKGDSISNAVSVANIITENLLKERSNTYTGIVDDQDFSSQMGSNSTIEIALKITNP